MKGELKMADSSGMIVEVKGAKRVLFTIALMLLTIAVMGEGAVMPLTYNIYEAFGDGFIANYIISAAALWLALGAIISAPLMARITKKRVLVLGAGLFAIGSIFCVAIPNPYYIAFMRSVMGLGEGIVSSVVMAYITQMWFDEEKRATWNGIFNAVGTITGAVMSFGAGVLSVPEWTNAFLVYIPSALAFFGALFFLPELGMEEVSETASDENTGKKGSLGMLFITFVVDYMLFCMMYSIVAYFISVYLIEVGIGDATLAGTLLAASTGAGFITSSVFGVLYAKLGKNATIPLFVAYIAAMLLLYFVPSIPTAFIAMVILGLGYGVMFPYSYAYVADVVPMDRVNDAISYTTASYSILFFAAPFLVTWMMGFTGGLVKPLYVVSAVLGVIALVIEISTNGAYKKHMASRVAIDEGQEQ